MADSDALSKFDFKQVTKPSVYLKFEAGKPVKVRVLTTDPIIYNNTFKDKETGDDVVDTKFAWIIYNFSDDSAQVMQTTANLAKKLGEIHTDEDFGMDITKLDLKITRPPQGVIAAYDVQVLPSAGEIPEDGVKELKNLAAKFDAMFEEKGGFRMNSYDPKKLKTDNTVTTDNGSEVEGEDVTDNVNLDDIPF